MADSKIKITDDLARSYKPLPDITIYELAWLLQLFFAWTKFDQKKIIEDMPEEARRHIMIDD